MASMDELALSVKDVRKLYNGNFEALKGVSLDIAQGDFFALLGPNGAGKSTLIGIISSLVHKTAGMVKVFGISIDNDFSKVKEYIGIVPQEFNFNIFETVEQIIVNQAGYYGLPYRKIKDRLDVLLKELSLDDKRHTRSMQLSGGMKRRLMIARALIHSPRLLILDEPTAGVDIELRRSMWNFITHINQQERVTVILTTHYLEEAEQLAKHVAIINHGDIVVNTTVKELLKASNSHWYILDLVEDGNREISDTFQIDGYTTEVIDSTTLAIEINNDDTVSNVFQKLTQEGIEVQSIKSKEHRLETLFIEMVGSKKGNQA